METCLIFYRHFKALTTFYCFLLKIFPDFELTVALVCVQSSKLTQRCSKTVTGRCSTLCDRLFEPGVETPCLVTYTQATTWMWNRVISLVTSGLFWSHQGQPEERREACVTMGAGKSLVIVSKIHVIDIYLPLASQIHTFHPCSNCPWNLRNALEGIAQRLKV